MLAEVKGVEKFELVFPHEIFADSLRKVRLRNPFPIAIF